MLDQTPGHDAVPANTGLQLRHLRLVPMILMPSEISRDTEERKQYLGSCMQTAIIDTQLILLEQVLEITVML